MMDGQNLTKQNKTSVNNYPRPTSNYKKLIIDWGCFLLGLSLVIFVNKTFFVDVYGGAMEHSIPNKSTVFRNIFIKDYKRGDIVFYNWNNGIYISRIVGLPGEKIKVEKHNVYVNDELLNESYINITTIPKECTSNMYCGPIVIPNDNYYMMGDNRGNSSDSRDKGTISTEQITGKAEFILWPLNKIRRIK